MHLGNAPRPVLKHLLDLPKSQRVGGRVVQRILKATRALRLQHGDSALIHGLVGGLVQEVCRLHHRCYYEQNASGYGSLVVRPDLCSLRHCCSREA